MITQLHGDCRTILHTMEPESVQCVVTSPPYFGLRDYGTAQWEGGDAECDHAYDRSLGGRASTLEGGKSTQSNASVFRSVCGRCGAVRIDRQIGLEPTPDCLAWARGEPPCGSCYVCTMRTVFQGLWRVLKADGVCWLNLGDSYSAANMTPHGGERKDRDQGGMSGLTRKVAGFKPKSLLLIPSRVALALQADGWIVRSDIVWAKGNPMPESVKDRPTRSHETIYLLAKQERYYYDQDAVREPCSEDMQRRAAAGHTRGANGKLDASRQDVTTLRGEHAKVIDVSNGRNLRDVWQINPKPYAGAHFAVFPEAIPERCIRASTKPGDTVLDPFGGSGTTARVATRLQRDCILIELNEAYIDLQEQRTDGVQVEMLLEDDRPAREQAGAQRFLESGAFAGQEWLEGSLRLLAGEKLG